MTIQKTRGRLILKEIEFNQVYEKTVHICNDKYGKVTLPKELIGKKVYVIVDPEGE